MICGLHTQRQLEIVHEKAVERGSGVTIYIYVFSEFGSGSGPNVLCIID
jgi:hypothetical protein